MLSTTNRNETLTMCYAKMTAPEGGFYVAQDADSEGVEGSFFVDIDEPGWRLAKSRCLPRLSRRDDQRHLGSTLNIHLPRPIEDVAW